MKQLKVKDILKLVAKVCQEKKMTLEQVEELPIYIGDDDELNGIHCAWFINLVDKNNSDDNGFVEMINKEYGHCIKLTDKGILIS